jgi:hypothetical protein
MPAKLPPDTQHEPRVPGGQADEPDARQDHPNKPFRTPNKTKTHPAPDIGTDGEPRPIQARPGQAWPG